MALLIFVNIFFGLTAICEFSQENYVSAVIMFILVAIINLTSII